MADAYMISAAAKGVGLESRITPRIAVPANEDLLEVVLENLIENALSVSGRGGQISVALERRLAVAGDAGSGLAVLRVMDRGPGVPEQFLDRIFERYVSLRDGGESVEGDHAGIGLWIVRRNLAAIGGKISAQNRPGGGLQVTVEIPLES